MIMQKVLQSWGQLLIVVSVATLITLAGCASMRGSTLNTPTTPTCEPGTTSTCELPPASTPESTSRIPPSERVPRVTIEELLQKIESNADIIIVDTRVDVEEQFNIGHIKGAIPVPLSKITAGEWIPPVDKEIILYCT